MTINILQACLLIAASTENKYKENDDFLDLAKPRKISGQKSKLSEEDQAIIASFRARRIANKTKRNRQASNVKDHRAAKRLRCIYLLDAFPFIQSTNNSHFITITIHLIFHEI
jgi:hypothetical protein